MSSQSKIGVLTVLVGGGFAFETRCLLQSLEKDHSFTYLVTEWGGRPGVEGIPAGPARRVPSFATVTRPSRAASLWAFVNVFFNSFVVLLFNRHCRVIVIGCSHAVPMLLAGRLLGRRTIFIESVTRVDRLSNTGLLINRLRLAGLFIVQWPALQKRHQETQLGSII